jgi:SagB-type dehydrogenase family enzyme
MSKSISILVISLIFVLNFLDCSGKKLNEQDTIPEVIQLPQPRLKSDVSIEEAFSRRRSVRDYKDESITLNEVSQLLWAAYGITQKAVNGPASLRGGFRTSPSAGALYPLEFYLVAGKVEGLKPGVYKYDSEKHELRMVLEGDKRKNVFNASLSQEMFLYAPATIVITANFSGTTGKYGKRGREHYVWLDAGHSAQNICLQCVSLGLSTCTAGAFSDEEISRVLNLPIEEEPIYLMPVGKKK